MCVCVYDYVCLYISKINDSQGMEGKIYDCYCKVLTLPRKWYDVISKWTWINCKGILQILGQPLKKCKE